MNTFTQYEVFPEDLSRGRHQLVGNGGTTADLLKVALTNRTPDPTADATFSDMVEIAAGNGYTAGGLSYQNMGSRVGSLVTIVGQDITLLATGEIGPFLFAVLYNSVSNRLIGYWRVDDTSPDEQMLSADDQLILVAPTSGITIRSV